MTISDWLASLALLISGVSAMIALTATMGARRARRHQEQIDERTREFRDVVWRGAWVPVAASSKEGEVPTFELRNVGTTEAIDVVLALGEEGGLHTERYALIPPGGSVRYSPMPSSPRHWVEGKLVGEWDDKPWVASRPWRVHWSSPLGHASAYVHPTALEHWTEKPNAAT